MAAVVSTSMGAAGLNSLPPFRVMTWNILASVHTHWSSAAHGGALKSTESDAQRTQRHLSVVSRLMNELPDVALLQEVDETFLPRDWKEGDLLPCGAPLVGYTPYRAYSVTKGVQEGVAVLLRDNSWKRDTRFPVTKIPKCMQTGWKNGIALHARRVNADGEASTPPVCFASVHLRSGKLEAQIGLLEAALEAADAPAAAAQASGTTSGSTTVGCPMVLGGDFNVETLKLAPLEPTLASRGLRRLNAPQQDTSFGSGSWVAPSDAVAVEASTSGDGSTVDVRSGLHSIDHLYATPDLAFAEIDVGGGALAPALTVVGVLPPRPLGPWSAGANDGSDHAWAMATLVFKAPDVAEGNN